MPDYSFRRPQWRFAGYDFSNHHAPAHYILGDIDIIELSIELRHRPGGIFRSGATDRFAVLSFKLSTIGIQAFSVPLL